METACLVVIFLRLQKKAPCWSRFFYKDGHAALIGLPFMAAVSGVFYKTILLSLS